MRQVFTRQDAKELVVLVIGHQAGNRSLVELDGGGRVLVDGQSVAPGGRARIRGGVIVGTAESCPFYEISV
jgi:hypothetical protein